jgi:putative ABC transport system permease protein
VARTLAAEAWHTARSQLRRSVLSSLSIGWGVATFVLLAAYGDSMARTLKDAFYAIGPDAIFITPGRTVLQAGGYRAGATVRFSPQDVEYLAQTAPAMGLISPELRMSNRDFAFGPRIHRSTLTGVWPEYGSIAEMRLSEGRWLSPEDQSNRTRVLVLATDLKTSLFGNEPAVGEAVQVDHLSFTVVGVLERKIQRQGDTIANDQAFTPFSSIASVGDARYLSGIVLTPDSPETRAECLDQVRRALSQRHRFHPSDPLAVRIFDVRGELSDYVESGTLGLRLLSLFIGLLTLGVGGVGIMNIMLVSVVARTREVGVAKSVGARNRDIFFQFLAEAMILCLAGGVMGVAMAYALGSVVGPMPLWSAIAYQNTGMGEVTLQISPVHIGIGWFLLTVVALASGLWPAWRAASLDPVEALRHE